MRYLLSFLMLISLGSVYADEIFVPDDYNTIQAGIDASTDGDTVFVAPGTYHENINFNGKAITVASFYALISDSSSIFNTIITSHPDSLFDEAVTFDSGEDTTSCLFGFSIMRSWRGIMISNDSNPIIESNIIAENFNSHGFLGAMGGGIGIVGSSPIIRRNLITRNEVWGTIMAMASGGGIYVNAMDEESPKIVENRITDNTSFGNECSGGGVSIHGNGIPVIINNIITDNSCRGFGGGIDISSSSNAILKNNLIRHNKIGIDYLENCTTTNRGGGIYIRGNSTPVITGNSITENYGGGVYIKESSPILGTVDEPNSIYNNIIGSGRDINTLDCSMLSAYLDTFTFLNPDERLVSPVDNLTINANYGFYPSPVETTDLYVNPDGDDQNSGLSESDPLQTINAASLRGPVSPQTPVTVHLSDGTYSYNEDQRNFTTFLLNSYHIRGDSPDNTIIDGGNSEFPIFFGTDVTDVSLSDLSLQNGRTALYAGDSSINVENCFVYSHSEAGIYVYSSSINISNSYFSNRIRNQYARSFGGIFLMHCQTPDDEVVIDNNLFEYNNGPAIWTRWGSPLIKNNVIRYNGASDLSLAGGISLGETSSSLITNNLIYGNFSNNSGAAIKAPFWQSELTLTNNTIVSNYSLTNGSGGIYIGEFEGAEGIIKNNIIRDNYNIDGYLQIETDTDNMTVSANNIQGGWAGNGNFDEDPQFADTLDWILESTSPCVDTGINSTPFNDLEDQENPGFALWPSQGGIRNDMGAYGGPDAKVLSPGWLEITFPNGGEEIQIDTEYTIRWNSRIAGPVDIQIVNEFGDIEVISENVENNGSYTWLAGTFMSAGVFKIQIRGSDLAFVQDRSDRYFTLTGSLKTDEKTKDGLPTEFAIESVYPSPFNAITNIVITLPESGNLTLKIYNILGAEIATLADRMCSAGKHTFVFNSTEVVRHSSGTYFIKAEVPGKLNQMQKIVLLK